MKTTPIAGLRPMKLPPHERATLSNGLNVHVVPRGPLPLVAVRLVMRGGSAWDAPGRLGVADFAARLLRRGAGGETADQLSEEIEFVGASLGGYANEETMIVSLSTPAKHLNSMLDVMAQVVLSPDFPDSEVELQRRRALAQLSNDLDDPGSLADRAVSRAIWGEHPYGFEARSGKVDITALTRDDLKEVHRSRMGPALTHLYIVGDATMAGVLPILERCFGTWKGGPSEVPTVPSWSGIAHAGEVIVVDKPEQTQVQMRIGARGVKRGHVDHFPLMVMNGVLGGSFTSRLMREIRVKRGLSYGAGSNFDMLAAAGAFHLSSFTKTETIDTLIDVALAEVARMRKKGPLPKEVDTVKRYISGLYPARMETNESVAGSMSDIEHYGLPGDWVERYRENTMQVTAKSAASAAAQHLFDGERALVLVGNAKALEKPASKYGRVRVMQPTELE